MHQHYKYKIHFIAILLIQLTCSCNKLVEVPPPIGQINRDIVFSSDATANSALAGLYIQLTQTNLRFSSIGMTLYPGLSADEFNNSTSTTEYDQFTANSLASTNSIIRSNFWLYAYQLIYQANNIISGLEASNTITPSLNAQLTGEAKFVRAFCYFYLVNLFGDVPLVTMVDYQTSGRIGRTASVKVYEQIIDDLSDAQRKLPADYVSPGRVRPNKWSASALLSRVYLYQEKWADAEKQATDVIGSGMYGLVTDLNKVFLAGSHEAIWQLIPATSGSNTWEGNVFIPGSTVIPAYLVTEDFYNAVSDTDLRKTSWLKDITIGTTTYHYPYKYKVRAGTNGTEDYMVLRLAELYLIRAEARANQNNVTGAIEDLNTIRSRAGLSAYPDSLTPSAVLAHIEQERRIELFAEWGHRWLDLKRTHRADAVLSNLKSGWQPTDTLYPIPALEIQSNPLLSQNSGYQ